MMRFAMALALVFFSATGMSFAQQSEVSIAELADRCSQKGRYEQGFCQGYMKAILEFRAAYDEAYRTRKTYCIPPAVPQQRLREEFVRWSQGNRDRHTLPALWGFTRALNDGWPC
jgi:hypothetical protein